MNCHDTQMLLHGYVDGELDLRQALEMEAHLNECAGCTQAHRALQALRSAVRQQSVYYEPPADLTQRVRAAVGGAGRDRRGPARPGWWAAAAVVLLAAVGVAGLLRLLPSRTGATVLTQELVASHVRSQMLPDHLVDVQSSDQHTVKPWFKGRLDFSPTVPDLSNDGFVLVGGRLDYLDHRPVAALVYQRRKHVINVFIWPGQRDAPSPESESSLQGFHLVCWTRAGMVHWAVSDLNESELREFVRRMEEREAER